jgi:hypothetical protein
MNNRRACKKDHARDAAPEKLTLSDFCGMKSLDIVGLFYGYKKIISTCLDPFLESSLRESFKKYGLVFLTLNQNKVNKNQQLTYIISKERTWLRQAAAAYKDLRYDVIGALLGYPACCCAMHHTSVRHGADPRGFVRACAGRSREFFWPLNNLLDFDGRLVGNKVPGQEISRLRYASLISHNPCSYDCLPSLEIAAKNFAYLKKHILEPGPESDYSALSEPVLYADDFNLAIFHGRSGPDGIDYSGTSCVLGLNGLREKLTAGDSVRTAGKELLIRKNGRTVFSKKLQKAPLILPFDKSVFPRGKAAALLNS